MPVSPLPALILYTRPGCHLCDEARDELARALADAGAEAAARGRPAAFIEVGEIDIETDPGLLRRYGDTIPVLADASGRELPLAMRPGAIRAFLREALDDGTADTAPDAAQPAGSPRHV